MVGWHKPGSVTVVGGGDGNFPNPPSENTPSPDPSFSVYSEALAVAAAVETNVITWVVPVTKTQLIRVEFGGCNIADYKLKYNGSTVNRKLLYFGGPLFGKWEYSVAGGGGQNIASGTTVTVTVIHNRPFVGDFWARIQYLEVN